MFRIKNISPLSLPIISITFLLTLSHYSGASTTEITSVYPDTQTPFNPDTNQINWSDFKHAAHKGTLSGTYQFMAGNYDLSSTVHIAPQQGTVTIRGGSDSRFIGNYSDANPAKISGGFSLNSSNIHFENMVFSNISSCIRARKNGVINNIIIKGLHANNTHSCILIDRNSNIKADNWKITNISIQNYYRTGIRVSGNNTKNITIQDFIIDGARPSKSHCYKSGIQILAAAQQIRLSDGEIKNNIGTCERYKQGDGIEIDDKQGTPHHIFINNVTVSNSEDANFDLKSDHVMMRSVTSKSNIKTKSGFKLWTYHNFSCENCDIQGNYEAMVRLISAKATFSWIDSTVTQAPNFRLVYDSPHSKPTWQ